jgi:hypothetical protein
MKALHPFALMLLCTAPALASVSVISPSNGATASSPVHLIASASPCSSQPITAMGYSLDASPNTIIVKASSLSADVPASSGKHVIHVKSWGRSGASCASDIAVNVIAPTTSTALTTTITVTAPLSGASIASPFGVIASGVNCSGQPISAMGYSLDNSTNTTIVNGTLLNG